MQVWHRNTLAYMNAHARTRARTHTQAGMLALRREGTEVNHEDFVEGISQVQAKKKATLNYYA